MGKHWTDFPGLVIAFTLAGLLLFFAAPSGQDEVLPQERTQLNIHPYIGNHGNFTK